MKAALPVLLALALLSGCIAEERGHAVKLGKGGYAGSPDTEITDATRLALRSRMASQADGMAEVAVPAGLPDLPPGQAAPSGRIAGQTY